VLSWSAVPSATGYLLQRGTGSGDETTTVVSGYPGTTYTDTGLQNNVTYYYVVAAIGSAGTGMAANEVSATPSSPNLAWTGAQNNAWNNTTYNWLLNGGYAIYADGDNVLFNDASYNDTVVIAGSVAPGTVTFANSNANYTLGATGGGITGTASLAVMGAGTVSLGNANTYTGGTTVSGGTLLVNNTNGSATGAGTVSVAGGTLGGTGGMAGAVTVYAGGFAPGNPLGTLTISNNLTLLGGTAFFQVRHSPLTNNTATVLGTLAEGGILNVTNTGGTLARGDSFILFNAGDYTGTFAGLTLPSLPPGLGWSTNTLSTSGRLSVIVTTHPVIGSVSLAQGGLVLQGGEGAAGANFYLLGTTNLAAPLTNWTRLLTNQFDGSGNFNFTNPMPANAAPGFYLLQLQ
jgi:autotransporter-associated beta strand protein